MGPARGRAFAAGHPAEPRLQVLHRDLVAVLRWEEMPDPSPIAFAHRLAQTQILIAAEAQL
jgi:hypothetical protein